MTKSYSKELRFRDICVVSDRVQEASALKNPADVKGCRLQLFLGAALEPSRPKTKATEYIRPSQNSINALEQDKAAGGAGLRRLLTNSGDVVTVSLSVSPLGSTSRVVLRFKTGGATIQRTVGTVATSSRNEALKLGWKMIREEKIVEKEGWSWFAPTS